MGRVSDGRVDGKRARTSALGAVAVALSAAVVSLLDRPSDPAREEGKQSNKWTTETPTIPGSGARGGGPREENRSAAFERHTGARAAPGARAGATEEGNAHPKRVLDHGFERGRTPVRFDSSCAHRPEARRGFETLEDVVEASSGLRGTDLLPEGERVLQFQFGWSDPHTGRSQITLKREPGSPAFHAVTFLTGLGGDGLGINGRSGANGTTTLAEAADRAAELTGNAARTVFLSVARTKLRARFGSLSADAVASPRVLLLERVVGVDAVEHDDGDAARERPPGATITKQAKFLNGAARSYFEPGLSCSAVDGAKGDDAWAACLCQAP